MLVRSRTMEYRSVVGPTPNVAVCAPARVHAARMGDKAKPPVLRCRRLCCESANDNSPLPAARLLRREGQRRTEAGLHLFRRGARATFDGQAAHQRRGKADRYEHCQVARATEVATSMALGPWPPRQPHAKLNKLRALRFKSSRS
jgi:hypothetical protein